MKIAKRTEVIVLIELVWLWGCTPPKQELPPTTLSRPPTMETIEARSPERVAVQTYSLLEPAYEGKYAAEAFFRELVGTIPSLRQEAFSQLASRLGQRYRDDGRISLELEDAAPGQKPAAYRITNRLIEGRTGLAIYCCTDYLVTRGETVAQVVTRAWIEAALRDLLRERFATLPNWLGRGLPFYGANQIDWVLGQHLVKILPGQEPADLLVGLGSPAVRYADLEGTLALLYLEETYGSDALKRFLDAVVGRALPWQDALLEATAESFLLFQERVRQFSLLYLGNQAHGILPAFRRALKAYLHHEYSSAIAQFQRLTFQFPQSFVQGPAQFRIAMGYYRQKNYPLAHDHFSQVLETYPTFCETLDLAKYRRALCLYYQKKYVSAVSELAEFIRDYSWSPLIGSAHYFLASCFFEQHHLRKAFSWFDRYVKEYAGEQRVPEALYHLGSVAQQLGWLREARLRYLAFLERAPKSPQAGVVQEAIAQLEVLEESVPGGALAACFDQLVAQLLDGNKTQQEAAREEFVRVGPIAFPWLKQALGKGDARGRALVVAILADLGETAAVPMLVELLHQEKEPREILLALLKARVPSSFLPHLVSTTLAESPPEQARRVQQALNRLFEGITPTLLATMPDLLLSVHESTATRLQVIRQLAISTGAEQVPLLIRLAREGETEVQREAARSLLLWHDPRSRPIFENLLSAAQPTLRILGVRGLVLFRDAAVLQLLTRAAEDVEEGVRLAAVESLAQLQGWSKIIEALEDCALSVHDRARSLLSAAPSAEVVPLLIKAWKEEGKSVVFYARLAEILEKQTGKIVSYHPEMDSRERERLVENLGPVKK